MSKYKATPRPISKEAEHEKNLRKRLDALYPPEEELHIRLTNLNKKGGRQTRRRKRRTFKKTRKYWR
jgi:hypothetical protein